MKDYKDFKDIKLLVLLHKLKRIIVTIIDHSLLSLDIIPLTSTDIFNPTIYVNYELLCKTQQE
jgi:hypothetical protein